MKLDERSWCATGWRVTAAAERDDRLFVAVCVGRVEDTGEGVAAGGGAACVAAGCAAPEPLSRTDGSAGGGPSSAHLRDSYLERMKDSILLGTGGQTVSIAFLNRPKRDGHTVQGVRVLASDAPPNTDLRDGFPTSG